MLLTFRLNTYDNLFFLLVKIMSKTNIFILLYLAKQNFRKYPRPVC